VELAADVAKYSIGETTGFPFKTSYTPGMAIHPGYPVDYYKVVDMLVVDDFEQNVKDLHKFLYDAEDYEPSDKVKQISAEIESLIAAENTTTTAGE